MKIVRYIALVLCAAVFSLNAQNKDNKLSLGILFGKTEYVGDLGNGFLDFKQKFNPFGGLVLNTYANRSFNFGIQANYGNYTYRSEKGYFAASKYNGFLFFRYKFDNGYILSENSPISVFLDLGTGITGYAKTTSQRFKDTPMDIIIPVGGGIQYKFSKVISAEYKLLHFFTNTDKHDLSTIDKSKDRFFEHSLGIVFTLGKNESKKIEQPQEPAKPKVVETKQPEKVVLPPVDTDRDGVPDSLDRCPDTPKGIKVDKNGCPADIDKDGVPDYKDKCPDTPNGVKVDANGCPIDSDNDGVPDYKDKCPNEKGPMSNHGCPEKKEEKSLVLHNLQYATAQSALNQTNKTYLDSVVTVMKNNPKAILKVKAYADSEGTDSYNKTLTKDRARYVKKYLLSKGVEASRVIISNYGKKHPIASNLTQEGRAKNRRSQLELEFY